MKPVDQLQTMTLTYQEICPGEEPWVALGNFMNDWFDYAKDRRAELVADPIVRMFANKYEFVEQYHRLLANRPYKASEASHHI